MWAIRRQKMQANRAVPVDDSADDVEHRNLEGVEDMAGSNGLHWRWPQWHEPNGIHALCTIKAKRAACGPGGSRPLKQAQPCDVSTIESMDDVEGFMKSPGNHPAMAQWVCRSPEGQTAKSCSVLPAESASRNH